MHWMVYYGSWVVMTYCLLAAVIVDCNSEFLSGGMTLALLTQVTSSVSVLSMPFLSVYHSSSVPFPLFEMKNTTANILTLFYSTMFCYNESAMSPFSLTQVGNLGLCTSMYTVSGQSVSTPHKCAHTHTASGPPRRLSG